MIHDSAVLFHAEILTVLQYFPDVNINIFSKIQFWTPRGAPLDDPRAFAAMRGCVYDIFEMYRSEMNNSEM